MLEVCFNDSVKGALILAQHCEDNLIGGAVSVISNRKGLLPFFSKRKAIKEYRRKYEKLQKDVYKRQVLVRICRALDCSLDDIVEILPEDK